MLILVVDDIEKNRLLLSRYLSTQGIDVLLAASGHEAVGLVKEHDIDLVLMDIKMPDMDGYEAARQIKAIRSVNYLPIIFVSALSEDDALAEAVAAGGDDYVTKPVSFEILKSKIDAHSRIRELSSKVNQQNTELNQHNRRLEREHQLVSHFFDQAREHCFFDENIIKTYSKSMEMFNGDTVLIGRRPNGGVSMLIGDFTGHGLSAAVGTLPVSQVFFSMLESNAYIGDIAKELNRQITILLPIEMFFAVSLIELSTKGDRLMVWHGGMPNAYLYDQSSNELKTIKSQHMPLGIRSHEEFDDSVQLFYVNDDCKFIAMTDGLTEAVNADNKMIGEEEYKKAICHSENIIDSIVSCYTKYSDGVAQCDDISILELTCVEVKRLVAEEEVKTNVSVPWEFNLKIEDEMLSRDVVKNIIEMIGSSLALKENKGVIYTLLMEMFTNALDHGILGLDGKEKDTGEGFELYYKEKEKLLKGLSGACINIKVSYVPDDNEPLLKIEMSHNGNEFDVAASNSSVGEALHGRGMELIDAISKEVVYSDNGRCLSITMAV
jgi:two-component system, HptB-dependent secretion and biofilm response regulator